MQKAQAQNIVRETFENPFDEERFRYFIKNLLNHIEEEHKHPSAGKYIPDAFKNYISSLKRIGKYTDGEYEIDALIVHLKKETSLLRARSAQRNFIARYLNGSRGGKMKDAALVAFVSPNQADWRFSLIKMEYKFETGESGKMKVREDFTPAKRWSYLVGENENSHTAQSKLWPIIVNDEVCPTLAELENAFNIEKVTKEFFDKYRELFLRTKEALDDLIKNDGKLKDDFKEKAVNTADFAKKLLGQIVFLYFLQKKGWFGVEQGHDWGTGSKSFMRDLFEEKVIRYKNFFNDVLEHLFYDALARDRADIDHFNPHFHCKIPFLNGGLFDPINGYSWEKMEINLPNDLFSNKYPTKEGDIGNGILDIFDRYNFTVKEDEPLEKEVAVDPEMLGKVFENLLEVKDRKSKGTYYTPREIAQYMCEQSLANYLSSCFAEADIAAELIPPVIPAPCLSSGRKAGIQPPTKDDLEQLIKFGENVAEHEAVSILKEENPEYNGDYKRLLPDSIKNFAAEIDEKLADIKVCDPAIGSGAFPVGMMNVIVKTRMALNPYLDNSRTARAAYNFKRDCIQNSLYGVDIDPGAVEIAKLRLWLSLVVDEDDFKEIKPLPNLDYKIVCGNSLLTVEKNLFNSGLFSELEELKPLFFNETNITKKRAYKSKIDEIIGKLTNNHKDFDFEIYFSEVFHQKNGFDVVIANPPYVEHKKLKSLSGQLKKFFTAYSGTADLYVYFYEKGINMLKNKGSLAFISSNKFIRTSYGEKLRDLLSSLLIQQIIDFTKVQVFDALVSSCVLIVIKDNPVNKVSVTDVDDSFKQTSLENYIIKHNRKADSRNFNSKIWQLDCDKKIKIKEKIESGSKPLGEIIGIHIYRGVTTGYNPAFVISENTKNELVNKEKKNAEIIKPLLQGRNIKKWFYNKSGHYLIQTGFDKDIKCNFPFLYYYLSGYENELKKRDDQGRNWWNLRACRYYAEFEKEKIIWGLTADKWAFAYDNDKHYLPSNGYILTSDGKLSVKYILALLNSNLLKFYFGFIGIMTAGGAYTLKHETISSLPIKDLAEKDQKPFVNLVDKILNITKADDYPQNAEKQTRVRALEREIDEMVYKLYDLTEEERGIVEGG